MWLTKLFAALMAVLAGLVPTSCTSSKNATAQQHTPIVTIARSADDLTNKNLGDLQLTNHYETCINLGAGKSCTIKPILLDRASLRLTMAVELQKPPTGWSNASASCRWSGRTNEPFEVARRRHDPDIDTQICC